MGQTVEHFFVQTFVSELTVEAFDEAVLLGFTGRDIVPVDADLRLPPQDGFAGKLCPIITYDCLGFAIKPDDTIKFASDPRSGQ